MKPLDRDTHTSVLPYPRHRPSVSEKPCTEAMWDLASMNPLTPRGWVLLISEFLSLTSSSAMMFGVEIRLLSESASTTADFQDVAYQGVVFTILGVVSWISMEPLLSKFGHKWLLTLISALLICFYIGSSYVGGGGDQGLVFAGYIAVITASIVGGLRSPVLMDAILIVEGSDRADRVSAAQDCIESMSDILAPILGHLALSYFGPDGATMAAGLVMLASQILCFAGFLGTKVFEPEALDEFPMVTSPIAETSKAIELIQGRFEAESSDESADESSGFLNSQGFRQRLVLSEDGEAQEDSRSTGVRGDAADEGDFDDVFEEEDEAKALDSHFLAHLTGGRVWRARRTVRLSGSLSIDTFAPVLPMPLPSPKHKQQQQLTHPGNVVWFLFVFFFICLFYYMGNELLAPTILHASDETHASDVEAAANVVCFICSVVVSITGVGRLPMIVLALSISLQFVLSLSLSQSSTLLTYTVIGTFSRICVPLINASMRLAIAKWVLDKRLRRRTLSALEALDALTALLAAGTFVPFSMGSAKVLTFIGAHHPIPKISESPFLAGLVLVGTVEIGLASWVTIQAIRWWRASHHRFDHAAAKKLE